MEPSEATWVLVAGGFHPLGGMDRINAALASHLAGRGAPVVLVAHHVDPALAALPGVTVRRVTRPAGSVLLGETKLARAGREAAREAAARGHVRMVTNGGNCRSSDVNWVHCVHAAWPCDDAGAPAWFRVKNRIAKWRARSRERGAVPRARLVVANSERTRRDLVRQVGVDARRIETVYPGSDPAWTPGGEAERQAARRQLDADPERPLVAFVGALSHDRNKGFDRLLAAWRALGREWDADLVVAGGGNGLAAARRRAEAAGLGRRVRFLGFTPRVGELLTAADLLVSPVGYEAYGLSAHEAICRGVPVLVSAAAGVAERFPPELAGMLPPDPGDPADLARRLADWRADMAGWQSRFARLGEELRRTSLDDMAARLVDFAVHAEHVEGGR